MFVAPIPDSIVMSLSIQKNPDICVVCAEKAYSQSHDELLRVLSECAREAPGFKIVADIDLDHTLCDQISSNWLPLSEKQESWQVDGLYVQVAFHNPALVDGFDPMYCAGHAMTVYDHFVCTSGTINPGQHKAAEVEANLARGYRLMIADLYHEKVGIWCASLMSFRNMVMIKCRAVLAGLDPEVEYAAYRVHRGYCLDFMAQRNETLHQDRSQTKRITDI